jgi:hypothetical protein
MMTMSLPPWARASGASSSAFIGRTFNRPFYNPCITPWSRDVPSGIHLCFFPGLMLSERQASPDKADEADRTGARPASLTGKLVNIGRSDALAVNT